MHGIYGHDITALVSCGAAAGVEEQGARLQAVLLALGTTAILIVMRKTDPFYPYSWMPCATGQFLVFF